MCAPAIVLSVRQRSPSGASRHLPRIGKVCLTEGAFLLSAKGLPHHDLDLHGGPGGGGERVLVGTGWPFAVIDATPFSAWAVLSTVISYVAPRQTRRRVKPSHLVGEAGVDHQAAASCGLDAQDVLGDVEQSVQARGAGQPAVLRLAHGGGASTAGDHLRGRRRVRCGADLADVLDVGGAGVLVGRTTRGRRGR